MKLIRQPKHGDIIDARHTMYPSQLVVISAAHEVGSDCLDTWMGYVLDGAAEVRSEMGVCQLKKGAFFSVPGKHYIYPNGTTVLFCRHGYRGQHTAGMIERQGRLSYIDGCSDTMLVYPPRLGDPVLNHLYFPPGIKQTQHTHPSIRLGLVAEGEGCAFGPKRIGSSDYWEEALTPGCVFLLEEQEMHSFRTTESQKPMHVIAYHPDSDWGPTDQLHPMLNRTYVGADVHRHT